MNRNAVAVRSRVQGRQWLRNMLGGPTAVQHVRAASVRAGFLGLGIDMIDFLGWSSALDGWV